MRPDQLASYEKALRRLIDLHFQARTTGRTSPEAADLEAAIYATVRRRPNPLAPAGRDGGELVAGRA